MISFIIPSYNNLRHLKNVYASIIKHAPDAEVILLDDGSTDGTWEWMQEQYKQDENLVILQVQERTGHTILYDAGIEYATNDIVGILHADMILGPNYIQNMIKHLQPGKVVCATRIEPPLHPPGKEKIIMDFGQDFDTLDIDAFEEFAMYQQEAHVDEISYGMFAPWILYKSDFEAIGGHDPLFAPFPYEDSDIFQRWILAGYELIQSRDAFVYHLTCRGHRWTEQVGQDDEYYKQACHKASRNYLRKWGSWIKNNEYQYPTIIPKYNIAFVVKHCTLHMLEVLEPWCDRIYIEDEMQVITTAYLEKEQPNTAFDLTKRVFHIGHNYPEGENDIIVVFDATQLGNHNFQYIQQLPEIITDNGEVGEFKLDCFNIIINNMQTYEKNLVKRNEQHIYI
ncbi:WcaA Glycosyltransferases involved in cell wall biogenesis [uncultured Caudovirales phage]|uniref:WcaA Glycosyltransferases involved in cell wall biogenesis n=1 Tax=uncultured Caudovirales phage TaxID=2100421 RepID=A0A6J5NJP1_9CAUD|nr:WcaA Glycosyltransferases involved in cell wall biogenesis [uncultured Caudovirales phage]